MLKRIIFTTLLLIWMITVFIFSNQEADESNKNSDFVANIVVKIVSQFKDLNEEDILNIANAIVPIIRKSAHFMLYALGGLISLITYDSYKNISQEDIKFVLLFCIIYAISDEIHQLFVIRKKRRNKRCNYRFMWSFHRNLCD